MSRRSELFSGESAQPETVNLVWVITKLFPLIATGVFASTTDLKKPESIALSVAMVTSTVLPVLSDALKLSGRLPQVFEIISNLCMAAGVGMMDQGAIVEDNKSMRSIIALTAVGCFSLFAMLNTIYSVLKLMGCIQEKKPSVELASSFSGFVGSVLFVTGNSLGYVAQKKAGKPTDVSLRMMIVASFFTIATAFHVALAGRAVCFSRRPDDNNIVIDDARLLPSSSSSSPSSSPTERSLSIVVSVPGSNSPRPHSL